jgi:hypothetical protein
MSGLILAIAAKSVSKASCRVGDMQDLYAEPFWASMEDGFDSPDMMVEMFGYPLNWETFAK